MSKGGAVRVRRVVCAVDCGTAINPDTVQAQIQSAILFGITAALHGRITLKNGRVEQANFDTYQMLRINEAPEIEVHIVQSSEAPGGMGECGTSAIVPAVANAIFAATGKRLAEDADRPRSAEAAGMNGTFRSECGTPAHSGLRPANFTTLAHFSVSSAISFPKSAGEPGSDRATLVDEPRPDHGIGEPGVDLAVEPVDDSERACPWARRRQTRCSPRSPARTRPPSGCPAAPPRASRWSPPERAACRP